MTQPQTKTLTEILQTQQGRLTDNVKCLTDISALSKERSDLVDRIQNASMFEKASLITEAVTFSLEIEARLIRAVNNLTRLAHDELAQVIQEHMAAERASNQAQEAAPEPSQTDTQGEPEPSAKPSKPARKAKPAAKREEAHDIPTD